MQPSQKLDCVAQVVKFINSKDAGYVSIETLCQNFKFSSPEECNTFISNNKSNFTISRKGKSPLEVLIWVKTELKLCEMHCRKKRNCDGRCDSLHICRTFLLKGSGSCPFHNSKGKNCLFGHNFTSPHNKRLLALHNLQLLKEAGLRTLFKRRTCRSMSTMPQLCLYYNDRRGNRCCNKNCKSLHFCMDYLKNMCIGECNRNHIITSTSNKKILDLFAIDETWTEDSLQEDLQQVMEHRRMADTLSHYSGSQCDYDEVVEDEDDDDDSADGASALSHDNCMNSSWSSQQNKQDSPCCMTCKQSKEIIKEMISREQQLLARVSFLERDVAELKRLLGQSKGTRTHHKMK